MDIKVEIPMETAKDCQHFLPVEVLLYLFRFFDLRTLVLDCRRVCKFWKETIESSDMWRIQLSLVTVSDETVENILPIAHNVYPWYICYALCNDIFGVNLFPIGTPQGSPRYWATDELADYGGEIYSTPIGLDLLEFTPPPQELIKEGLNYCFLASIGECSVNHTIDLYARGFTRKTLEFQPPIFISEWFTVRRNFIGVYNLDVLLFNSQWEADYENGQFKYQTGTDRTDWFKVTHTFTNYRPDVKYITFHHGVNSFSTPDRGGREDESQDPIATMAGAKVIIGLPEAITSV